MSVIDRQSVRTLVEDEPLASGMSEAVPLCVDLDGTLISSNLLAESLAILLAGRPWYVFALPYWLLAGRAALKDNVARRVTLTPSLLPYNESLLQWIAAERASGRRVLLATASDREPAEHIARYLDLFDEVLGSDGRENCKGATKLKHLHARFGRGFDYVGNSRADLAIWQDCRQAVVVHARPAVLKKARERARVVKVFERKRSGLRVWSECLRLHQWNKNLLVFVPLMTSHRLTMLPLLLNAGLVFLSLGLCASGVYLLNDIVDLDVDRRHEVKRGRPLASGRVSALTCVSLAPVLIGGGLLISGLFLPRETVYVLLLYIALATAYSLWIKRLLLADVFCLAAFYSLRLVTGRAAYGVDLSVWLLSFSLFLFLSLGFCKRTSELYNLKERNAPSAPGRGYRVSDLEQINLFGVASGFIASLVLALYAQSAQVRSLYKQPQLLWLLLPLMLYWITRIWILASRGQMNEDPVLFAVRDKMTWGVGASAIVLMLMATRVWIS